MKDESGLDDRSYLVQVSMHFCISARPELVLTLSHCLERAFYITDGPRLLFQATDKNKKPNQTLPTLPTQLWKE